MLGHRLSIALVIVAGGLSATACGGSSSPTATQSSNGLSVASPTPTISTAGGGGGGSLCQAAISYAQQVSQFTAALSQPGANPLTTMQHLFSVAATAIDQLDGSPPAAIATSVHTLRVAVDQTSSNLQGVTTYSTQAIQAAIAPLETDSVKTASHDVSTYYKSTCGA